MLQAGGQPASRLSTDAKRPSIGASYSIKDERCALARSGLPKSDGSMLYLDPRVRISKHDAGYFCTGPMGHLILEADEEGCLLEGVEAQIQAKGFTGPSMWTDPQLCRALFDWDPSPEVDGVIKVLGLRTNGPQEGRGLDVGCGFGRLLVPMLKRGLRVDGVDASGPLLRALAGSLREDARLFGAPLQQFVAVSQYDWAFAALNTVRYLVTKVALRAHLRAMAQTLKPLGRYLFNISVPEDPSRPGAPVSWPVVHRDHARQVEWGWHEYCHLRQVIIDRIRLLDPQTQETVYEEYQAQAYYSLPLIKAFAEEAGLRFEALYDNHFNSIQALAPRGQTVWIELHNTPGAPSTTSPNTMRSPSTSEMYPRSVVSFSSSPSDTNNRSPASWSWGAAPVITPWRWRARASHPRASTSRSLWFRIFGSAPMICLFKRCAPICGASSSLSGSRWPRP